MRIFLNPNPIRVGQIGSLNIRLEDDIQEKPGTYRFEIQGENGKNDRPFPGATDRQWVEHTMETGKDFEPEVKFATAGPLTVIYTPQFASKKPVTLDGVGDVLEASPTPADYNVALVPADPPKSSDEVLWRFTSAISRRMRFDEFRDFVQPKLPGGMEGWFGTRAYEDLKSEAEKFVTQRALPFGFKPQNPPDAELSESTIAAALERSYVRDVRSDAKPFLDYPYGDDNQKPDFEKPLKFPLPNVPFVELIWNYWAEEGMLVQTLHHVVARFQNRRPGRGADPLLRFDLNPLMPMRTLLWGFAEDEQNRLTVRRRSAEYEYEYGLRLRGRAVPHASVLADRRVQFLEGFHRLLHACVLFYKERDDKTVDADAFPLLSNLQEVHLVLARGAHNQFANLAVTARAEMLTMQWLLAQPEMHEFLGGPAMIPYEEPWMDRVDTMKSLQGWSDTSITHFFELAVQGEQILLSVRHGRWNESTRKREDAANWALLWRNEIQRYIHSYATVTGIDLVTTVDATMPSELIARRLMRQRRRA
ncbi:hypothetical protein EEB14_20710 [Rhodococcus sp. WS4]|nr:hypothetical protein EEB14_20710 [Rhodococcus sp. WS4]